MTTSTLEVHDLTKRFGGFAAVDGVSFSLQRGERLALIGPNGAGKTTCFNMLNGQLTPNGGRVVLDGRDVTGVKPQRMWSMGVGRTFQITATFATMTVVENVQMVLMSRQRRLRSLLRTASRTCREPALALLERVGMHEQAERACGVLAYGDLKRLELAIALAHEPRLLLMDEPTAGMASAERGNLMQLVDSLVAERDLAVLFTEHDMDVVFGHADRVIVLAEGKLVADGPPEAVRADATERAVYLGSDDAVITAEVRGSDDAVITAEVRGSDDAVISAEVRGSDNRADANDASTP